MVAFICQCVVAGKIFACGAALLFGVGGQLVAGYNHVPTNRRAKRYHRIFLCGVALVLVMALLLLCGSAVAIYIGSDVVSGILYGVFWVWVILGIIWLNFSGKMRNAARMAKLSDEEIESEENTGN